MSPISTFEPSRRKTTQPLPWRRRRPAAAAAVAALKKPTAFQPSRRKTTAPKSYRNAASAAAANRPDPSYYFFAAPRQGGVRRECGAPPLAPGTFLAQLWDDFIELREQAREQKKLRDAGDREQERLDRLWAAGEPERQRLEKLARERAEAVRLADEARELRRLQNDEDMVAATQVAFDVELARLRKEDEGRERSADAAEETLYECEVHLKAFAVGTVARVERKEELRAVESEHLMVDSAKRVALREAEEKRQKFAVAVELEQEQEAVQIIAERATGLVDVDRERAERIVERAKVVALELEQKKERLRREEVEEAEEDARLEEQNRAYENLVRKPYGGEERPRG